LLPRACKNRILQNRPRVPAACPALALFCLALLLPTTTVLAQAPNVLTWRYDNTHQGQNTQETILTPSNVNTNTFGKLFSYTVDGQVYAQPLYVQNLTLPNQTTHNVIFIADEHDSVYAFDADSNGGSNSAPLWQASMLSTAHGAAAGATTVPTADIQSGTGDIHPEIGISATPVIDLNTLFVVAKTKENGVYVQRLHALNILNGNEQTGSPVVITGSVPGKGNGSSGGTLTFSSLWEHNRPAMGLFNGNIYIGFAAHADNGPWHGWVMVYNETTLKQTAAICTSPNGNGDGIWMSGAGFPIDTVTANGRAFLATGNGDLTTYPPLTASVDYGDSILRFDLSSGGFAISDAFTPFNQSSLSGGDIDQGSGGVLLLPDQAGAHPHELVQVGKEGRILVLNRDKLNGYLPGGSSNTNALQDITGALGNNSGLWSTPAYWNGNVYTWADNDSLRMFPITNGVLATRSTSQSAVSSGFPGATPVVSSNGTQNGIVWAIETDLYSSNGSSILYAFNALNVGSELYASYQNETRDNPGPAIKFTVPVVTNGKVYVGAGYQVDVYGLLNAEQQTPAPSISPAGGPYTSAQQVTITDTITSAPIYYTTDGTTPTVASTKYAGAFTLSADATVQAIASASGYLQSAVASATYSFSTQTAIPQISPAGGTYSTAQSVTITDTTSGAQIYYTTDGSIPTANSTLYTAAIPVSSNTTIRTIAVAIGLAASNVVTAAYSIQAAGTAINFGNGFASVAGMTLNGSATNVDDSRLQLTTGLTYQAGSAFWNTPVNIQSFTTDFSFQLSNAQADGFTFTLQNVAPTAVGGYGISLGYGPNPTTGTSGGIAKSVALKFDFYNNAGEGTDSTGMYLNGAMPTIPAIDLTSSGIVLASGDTIAAHITYDGTNLILTLTDNVVNKTFTHTFPVNIPTTIGGNNAYVGFTGGSGGLSSSQKIESWTFSSSAASATKAPSFSPAPGPYSTAQNVTLTDASTGATIYYTIDGSTPTTASTVYSAGTPIGIDSGTVTINAIAQAPGLTASSVASATYTIQTATAADPAFSPLPGVYTVAQNVSLSCATPGPTIYYTVDGSTPTHSSSVYNNAPIVVSGNSLTIRAFCSAGGFQDSPIVVGTYQIQAGGSPATPISDEFTGTALNTALWQVRAPAGGSATVSNGELVITVPGGTNHDPSVPALDAVQVVQPIGNVNFDVAVKIDSTLKSATQYSEQGLMVEGDATDYIRFEIGAAGTTTTLGVFTQTAGVQSVKLALAPFTSYAVPTYLRMQRVGTTYTAYWSSNGTTWNQAVSFTDSMVVTGLAPYAGNYSATPSQATALTATFDWFHSPATTTTAAAAAPTFSPASGTSFSSTLSVSLTDTTPGATIYYTTDGSAPTTASLAYTTSFTISASTTVNAIAVASGYTQSPAATASYTYLPVTSGSPVSDEFNTASLNTALWQVRAPVGGSATVSNGELVITVPGGSNHDPSAPAPDAVQVVQPISNVDFDVAVKIDSTLTSATQYSEQGLMVEGDANDYIRYEIGAGGTTKVLGVTTDVGGVLSAKLGIVPFTAYAAPTYLRLQRVGTTYTVYWSTNGTTWTQAASFTDTMVVTGLAPYAGNYNATPGQATALTATFDWFHNRATDGP
jgi:hypothetical protein